MSFYNFIKSQSVAFQDETLGVENAEKLRAGEINSTNIKKLKMAEIYRPITLEEMNQKDSVTFGELSEVLPSQQTVL